MVSYLGWIRAVSMGVLIKTMTALTTKTAQSLHAAWCRQMREKGWHGPDLNCVSCEIMQQTVYSGNCNDFHIEIIPWPDLHPTRRQEYLSTAKAVLPEIVGELLGECLKIAESCEVTEEAIRTYLSRGDLIIRTSIAAEIQALRDRCLEEIKK